MATIVSSAPSTWTFRRQTQSQRPKRRFTLADAERKLLSFDQTESGSDISLRSTFSHPSYLYAEDVYVEREICLRRRMGDPNRERLSHEISDACLAQLQQTYSASSKENSKLLLKFYLLDVSEGDRQSRIYATDSGLGLVTLTIGWILTLSDGSIVLDGGRLHELDSHFQGLGDVFHLQNAETTLHSMAKTMCNKIIQKAAIES
eukprot:Nitzschia sp. Nitz4//scaffold269_size25945//12135//12746//NITZ4_008289-RA/size25945-processed-gene-0.20-mRNA-1//1//CDS//3329544967//7172//frame0